MDLTTSPNSNGNSTTDKVIIIIPYRNRETHLKYFLEKSYPLLKTVLSNLEIIIVEQSDDTQLFNRGKLLNIGYHYYDREDFVYFNHDVDVNPIGSITLAKYAEPIGLTEIQGLYTSVCDTLGGIIKFRGHIFKKINGFPNDYFGWGCEDKALKNRADFYGVNIKRFITNKDPHRNQYFTVFDQHDRIPNNFFSLLTDTNYNKFKLLDKTKQEQTILSSGLNTLTYKIIKTEKLEENVIKITVSI